MNNAHPIRVVVCSSLIALTANAQTLRFDRNWWTATHNDEKSGFFWGYMDSPCAPAISSPEMEVEKFLDGYFPNHENVSVPSALQVAAHRMKPWKSLPGGEIWTEAHGFMDGGWWGDGTPGHDDEKLGYVEGYLACKHQPVRTVDVHAYVAAVDKYYDSPKHERTKIAYVVEPLIARREAH